MMLQLAMGFEVRSSTTDSLASGGCVTLVRRAALISVTVLLAFFSACNFDITASAIFNITAFCRPLNEETIVHYHTLQWVHLCGRLETFLHAGYRGAKVKTGVPRRPRRSVAGQTAWTHLLVRGIVTDQSEPHVRPKGGFHV